MSIDILKYCIKTVVNSVKIMYEENKKKMQEIQIKICQRS